MELPRPRVKKQKRGRTREGLDWFERVTCKFWLQYASYRTLFSVLWVAYVLIHHIVEDASSGIFSPFPFRPQDLKISMAIGC